MHIKDKRITNYNMLYVVALIIFMMSTLFELTQWNLWSDSFQDNILKVTKLMRYLSYLLCVIKIIMTSVADRKTIIRCAIIVVMFAVSYLACKNITLFLYSLLFLAAEGYESDGIIRIACICQSVVLAINIILIKTGIVVDSIWEPDIRPRHFLGFSWVTTSSILFLFILFEYIYLKKGKINTFEYIIGMGFAYWLYKMSDARMTFMVSVLVLTWFWFIIIFVEKINLAEKLKSVFAITPFIISIVAITFQYIYSPDNTVLYKLNDILTGRLKLGRQGIEEYGLSLFGTKIEWVGYDADWESGMQYNYVDSSYLQIALEYGLIVLVIILILYAILIYASIRNKHTYLCWIVLIVLAFCVTEPRLVKIAYNPFLLLVVTELEKYITDINYERGGYRNEKTEVINS